MEREVSLVGCLLFARRPDEDHEILVSVILIVGCKEEDGGDYCYDLDYVGVGRLAVFDLEVSSFHFEERG